MTTLRPRQSHPTCPPAVGKEQKGDAGTVVAAAAVAVQRQPSINSGSLSPDLNLSPTTQQWCAMQHADWLEVPGWWLKQHVKPPGSSTVHIATPDNTSNKLLTLLPVLADAMLLVLPAAAAVAANHNEGTPAGSCCCGHPCC